MSVLVIRRWLASLLVALVWSAARSVSAQELAETRKLLTTGHYEEVVERSAKAIEDREREEEWRHCLIQAQLALGRYAEALATATNALRRFPASIRNRLVCREALLANGRTEAAAGLVDEINELGLSRRWNYRDAQSQTALGSAAILLGADPKVVLDNFFEPARRADPTLLEPHLAAGKLALEKQDYALAAKYFNEGLKHHPEEPDLHFGLAQSFAPDDRPQMVKSLQEAFDRNPRHVPGLLALVDHLIDAEEYGEAEVTLKKIEAVNPRHPEAWAYRAVIAQLLARPAEEKAARAKAGEFYPDNPRVAYLIGLKLSQKYRFTEGSRWQRQAVAAETNYLPARFQLAQDLLRLGENEEGWGLAESVHQADAYNVGAYNLVTLRDTLAKFETFTNGPFIVRMSAHERAIYGGDVLDLLTKARTTLCAKYGSTLEKPVTVEIFPEQKDFAIRTFGMPGGEGFLGVCFGSVITANSPASQNANPSNWKAMLWHEFCHVVTLQMTGNKMPRWLSEGISVFEERAANPAWGQVMNPRYREMVMEGELKEIGDMSSAFLSPESDLHLQFAYYQASMVVEFIVERFGIGALQRILRSLAEGVLINDAIEKDTVGLAELDKDFKAHMTQLAKGLAPDLDWTPPKYAADGGIDPVWAVAHPKSHRLLLQQAGELMEEKKWAEAKEPLGRLVAAYPGQTGAGNAASRLAEVHRALNETEEETRVLRGLAARDAEAPDVYERLMTLDAAGGEWERVVESAERFRAVNPLQLVPNEWLFRALRELNRGAEAVAAGEKLLRLQPPDRAGTHFEMARLLETGDPGRARAHVLRSLEEAPRYREAHRLLLRLTPPAL